MPGIIPEIWEKTIEGNLFPSDSFLQFSKDASEYVNDKVVHKPHAGGLPNVERNRTVLPAAIQTRTDSIMTYEIDEFTTDPFLIKDAEMKELSYDKRASALEEHTSILSQKIHERILHNWFAQFAYVGSSTAAASPVIRTSGVAVPSHTAGSTGNRKKLVKEDLKNAATALKKANKGKLGSLYALLSVDMMAQLLDDVDLIRRDSSAELDMKNGVITRLYGLNLLERSDTLRYTNAATPVVRDPEAAGAATDNDSVLVWSSAHVERAKGAIKFFDNRGKAEYYGDVFSFLARAGGTKRRKDAVGTLAIVQASAA